MRTVPYKNKPVWFCFFRKNLGWISLNCSISLFYLLNKESYLMKILMISPQPFFEPRGTPISVYQRLEALSALGHEIDLITYHVGKDVDFPNVKIHRVRNIKMIQRSEERRVGKECRSLW